MHAPTLRPTNRRPGLTRRDDQPLLLRAALPALGGSWPRPRPATAAAHDFLVPNPRPDLTTDLHTLRMIEVA